MLQLESTTNTAIMKTAVKLAEHKLYAFSKPHLPPNISDPSSAVNPLK